MHKPCCSRVVYKDNYARLKFEMIALQHLHNLVGSANRFILNIIDNIFQWDVGCLFGIVLNNTPDQFVPPGTTRFNQVADVRISKGFKKILKQKFRKFHLQLVNQHIANGTIPKNKTPGFVSIREWIVEAWSQFKDNNIVKTIKSCYLAENPEDLRIFGIKEFTKVKHVMLILQKTTLWIYVRIMEEILLAVPF